MFEWGAGFADFKQEGAGEVDIGFGIAEEICFYLEILVEGGNCSNGFGFDCSSY